eukprot:391955-Prymnesium_polylepis.2
MHNRAPLVARVTRPIDCGCDLRAGSTSPVLHLWARASHVALAWKRDARDGTTNGAPSARCCAHADVCLTCAEACRPGGAGGMARTLTAMEGTAHMPIAQLIAACCESRR